MHRRHDISELFPAELWMMIKSCIAKWDLRTHACFFAVSSPLTEALYGDSEAQAAFCQALCLNNGIGLLPYEDPYSVNWKHVVMECTREAFCKHPGCGEKQLEENCACRDCRSRICLLKSLHDVASLLRNSGFRCMSWSNFRRKTLYRPVDDDTLPEASNIFQYLAFTGATADDSDDDDDDDDDPPVRPPPSLEEGYLRHPEFRDQELVKPTDLMINHVIAQRSFAVFPPVPRIRMNVFGTQKRPIDVFNGYGVTVWDVYCAWLEQ